MNDLNWTALFGFLAAFCLFMLCVTGGMVKDKENGSDEIKSTVPQLEAALVVIFSAFLIFGSLTVLTWGG